MTKTKGSDPKVNAEYHEMLKATAQDAMEDLLQDTGVPLRTTLKSLEELASLIQGHIEGLRDDVTAGRG